MNRNDIRTPGDALDYLTDCTLATVCDLAAKKSRSQYELLRQIQIAQTSINLMRQFGVKPTSRAEDVVVDFAGNVTAWAAHYDVKAEPKRSLTPTKGQP